MTTNLRITAYTYQASRAKSARLADRQADEKAVALRRARVRASDEQRRINEETLARARASVRVA